MKRLNFEKKSIIIIIIIVIILLILVGIILLISSDKEDKNENKENTIEKESFFSKLDETTVSKYYGTTVATLDGVEYGLFYVDYAGDFGEAGTVYLRAKTSIDMISLENPSVTDEALKIMEQLNPEWKKNRANDLNDSEKGIVHLCNPEVSNWSGAKRAAEEKYGANNVNYVIGAPSIELFIASYNAKYGSIYSTKYFNISSSIPEVNIGRNEMCEGYLYSNDNGASYTDYINAIPVEGVNEIYRSAKEMRGQESNGVWLASPLTERKPGTYIDSRGNWQKANLELWCVRGILHGRFNISWCIV